MNTNKLKNCFGNRLQCSLKLVSSGRPNDMVMVCGQRFPSSLYFLTLLKSICVWILLRFIHMSKEQELSLDFMSHLVLA